MLIGKDISKQLRDIADWIESNDGQIQFKDTGATDSDVVTTAVVDILNFAKEQKYRTDKIHFYAWLRHFLQTNFTERDNDYHTFIWKALNLVDRKDDEVKLG